MFKRNQLEISVSSSDMWVNADGASKSFRPETHQALITWQNLIFNANEI